MSETEAESRLILRLALPALGALAIDPLLSLADTAFVARLGVVELAALGVDTAVLGFVFLAFNFLAYAVTPLVAQARGGGDMEKARRWAGDALLLAVALGAVGGLGLQLLAPWAVGVIGAGTGVVGPAIGYLRIRALAAPAVLVVTAGHGIFRGHQDTRTPLYVALAVNLANLVLDPLLIFGAGWGLAGAAWATVAAQTGGAVWFIRLLVRRKMVSVPAGVRAALPSLAVLGRSGVLVTARTVFLLLALAFAAAAATRIGPTVIAAHQVVLQVWLLAAMVVDAFAIAAQALVGEAVGAADRDRAHRLSLRLLTWGGSTGVALLAAFLVSGPLLGGLSADGEVAAGIASATRVAGWMMPLAAAVFVADGIFFGLFALGTIVASTGAGALLLVFLLEASPLGNTLDGIWWGVAAMLVGRGSVYLVGYRRSVRAAVSS